MTSSSSVFDRLDQAAKLSAKLVGKAASRTVCDAFVRERITDIRKLQQDGTRMAVARYARLLAPELGVRPAALVAAIQRALPPDATPTTQATPAEPAATQSNDQAPAQPAPRQPPEPSPTDQESAASVASAVPSPPEMRSRLHPTLPNVELPGWADWSDQMPEESDADYIFRKALEMPPASQRKFIGESVEERAEALLKKLDFGGGVIKDDDRDLLRKLVKRHGADAVQRCIEAERKAHPGAKLYPSTLHQRMTGGSHA